MSYSDLQPHARPRQWHRLVDPLLQVTVVLCIFSFKFFFVRFGEAGLRPDDLLIALSFVGLMLAGRVRRTPISLPLRLYFIYVAVEIASAFWNGWQGRVGLGYSLVFVIRLLEYVVFYFIGYSLARSGFQLMRVLRWYVYLLCVLVPLQMLRLAAVSGVLGFRASANTNGPYELAIVAGFLLCFVAYRKRSFFVGSVAVVLVILSASRITLVAVVLSLLHFAVARTRSLGKVLALAGSLAVAAGGLYLLSTLGVVEIGAFDRLQNSSSLSFADARAVYDAAPTAKTASDYMEGSFQDLNGLDTVGFDGDLSGLIRFTRWLTLLKTNVAHVDSILIGLGPSFGSAAVDGYYTRGYVETGVLGLGTFLIFLGSLLFARRGSSWEFREYVLIMIVSALFIDIFLSYKAMMLLWLWHGLNQYRAKPKPERLRARSGAPLRRPEAGLALPQAPGPVSA